MIRRSAAVALALAQVVILAGACGGDGDGEDPASDEGGTVVSPVEDVLVARLTLAGEPDWLAVDEHGIWVQQGSGVIARVDPATSEATEGVDVGVIEHCQGMGASYGAVWTCAGSDVLRLDPETFDVVARVKVQKQATQGHLVGGFDRVWVLTSDGSNLVGIDPETNRVATEFELPARCVEVTIAEDALWLSCGVDDRVLKVDPVSGEVLLDLEIANPVVVAVDGDVWVGTATTTVQLDPATGDVLAELDAGAAPEGDVELDEDSIWVRNSEDFLIRFDRETGARVQQITADLLTGGDMLLLDGHVWVSAYDDHALFHVDPSLAAD